jgi:cardiolipin synthase
MTAAAPAERPAAAPVDVDGNRLSFVEQGPERLDRLIAVIDGAARELLLYYYTFADDAAGRAVLDRLLAARARGVAVTLLVDAFGSATSRPQMFAPLIDAGGRFGWFGRRHSSRYLIRNHQKMTIADGEQALIGGFNVERDYFAAPGEPGWCDIGLVVEGPAVARLRDWYGRLAAWVLSERQSFRALRRLVRHWNDGEGALRWTMGGPTRLLSGWARQARRDLQTGRRLHLVAAYFSPGRGMIRRIRRIARRGEAHVIVASKSDNMVTVGAARYLYARLLRAGTHIHEYQTCMLHMKLIVVDDIVYVGSANFDKRSLFINVELMLRVEDAAFAEQARACVGRVLADSRTIDRAAHRAMAGPVARLRWWVSYLLVGVLDYTVTRRLNFGSEPI